MQSMGYRHSSDARHQIPELPVSEIAEAAGQFLVEAQTRVVSFTKENPGPALGIAVLFGFIVARVFRRRRRAA